VADFIGRANFVQGTVKGLENGRLTVEVLGSSHTVPAAHNNFQIGQEVTLVVRPEMVMIDPPADAHATGIVREAAYLGSMVEYDVEVNGQLLSLVENDPRRTIIHSEGEQVAIQFLDDCLYVIPD
jgi:iron(III) transport system ATP-binding protein